MKRLVQIDGREGTLELAADGSFSIEWSDAAPQGGQVDAKEAAPGVWSILWDGESYETIIEPGAVIVNGRRFRATARDPRDWSESDANSSAHGPQHITSPMPGKVVRILVAAGDEVEAGQGIVVVEAMKMQNEMPAPRAGRVSELRAALGATVAAGEVLATIE